MVEYASKIFGSIGCSWKIYNRLRVRARRMIMHHGPSEVRDLVRGLRPTFFGGGELGRSQIPRINPIVPAESCLSTGSLAAYPPFTTNWPMPLVTVGEFIRDSESMKPKWTV